MRRVDRLTGSCHRLGAPPRATFPGAATVGIVAGQGATADPAPDAQEPGKRAAGREAAELVRAGMRVGLGTGSTVHWTIVALGERSVRDVVYVATSKGTEQLARAFGLPLVPPDEAGHLDLAVDGADEVDPRWNLVKGGGGALAREKVVAEMADRFVVVVDETKLVPQLGAFGLPVETLDFAPGVVAERLRRLGANRVTRLDARSDNGNPLLRAWFGAIADPAEFAARLGAVPGIVEHGLFLAPTVSEVLVGSADGRVLSRTRA
jgi:ribose 5-phosphate isomerase A